MDKLRKILFNKKGSSLIVVIVVFASITILGTALITVVSSSYDSSIYYHRQQQAELTAKSVMKTMQSAISDPTTCAPIVGTMMANTDTPYTSKINVGDSKTNMGSADVTMVYNSSKARIQIDVLANFQGTNSSVSAVFKRGNNNIDPLDFNIFATFGGLNVANGAGDRVVIGGQVMSRGSLNLKNCEFKDNVINTGAFTAANCVFQKKVINQSDSNVDIGLSTKLDPTRFYTTAHNPSPTFQIDSTNPAKRATDLNGNVLELTDFANVGISASEIGIDINAFTEVIPVSCGYIADDPTPAYFHLENGHFLTNAGPATGEVKSPDGYAVDINYPKSSYTFPADPNTGIVPPKVTVENTAPPMTIGTGENAMYVNFVDRTVILADGVKVDLLDRKVFFPTVTPAHITDAVTYAPDFFDLATASVMGGGGIVKYSLDQAFIDKNGTVNLIPNVGTYLSGTITKNVRANKIVQKGTVLFDTTLGDINVFAPDGLDIADDTVFKIKGDNSVHIILGHGLFATPKEIKIGKNCDLGAVQGETVATDSTGVQLFIWGQVATQMTIEQGASLKIATYLVGNGTNFIDNGSELVKGTITANGVMLNDVVADGKGINYSYLAPLKRPSQRTTLRTDKYYMYPKAGVNSPFELDYWGKLH